MDEEVDGEMTMRSETEGSTVVIGMDPGGMTDIQITTMRDKGKLLYIMTDGEIVVMVDQAMGGGVVGTMTTRVSLQSAVHILNFNLDEIPLFL